MNRIATIPNLLSLFRILLIPVFVILYFSDSLTGHSWYAFGVLALSGLTDVLDGIIARKFNMVSDLGKVLDPAADKLTQAAMVVCICVHHTYLIPMMVLFFAKEFCMVTGAMVLAQSGVRPVSARWWGKLSTVIIYITVALVVLTDIYPAIPEAIAIVLALLAVVSMLFSLVNYVKMFLRLGRQKREEKKEK